MQAPARFDNVLSAFLTSDPPRSAHRAFEQAAADSDPDSDEHRAYALLRDVFGYTFHPKDPDAPFAPFLVIEACRSPIPDDLSDDDLSLLPDALTWSDAPSCRARILDVLLLRTGDRQAYGHQAAMAYLEVARMPVEGILERQHVDRHLWRGAHIACALGRKTETSQEYAAATRTLSADASRADESRLSAYQVLYEFRWTGSDDQCGDELVALAGLLGPANPGAIDFDKYRECLALAKRFYDRETNPEGQANALRGVAESYVRQSELAEGAKVRAEFLDRSIPLYRQLGDKEKVAEVAQTVRDLQREAVTCFQPISVPFDPTEMRTAVLEHMRGLHESELIRGLATCARVATLADLYEQAEEHLGEFIAPRLFGTGKVIDDGKTVDHGRSGACLEQGGDERDEFLLAQVQRSYGIDVHVAVLGAILPALEYTQSHLAGGETPFRVLCTTAAFIPQGREVAFERAFEAGLRGDWFAAMHFLIPQVEHAVRTMLESSGCLTTKSGRNNTQTDMLLPELLDHPKTLDIFGEDYVFALKYLLTEQGGANLRNKLAHGLAAPGLCFSPQAVYLWWLVLHITSVLRQTSPDEITDDELSPQQQ